MSIPIAILCGGKGTRIVRGVEDAPKPLVEVGGRPILWHVMAVYARHGFRDFVLLTGWQRDRVEGAAHAFDEVRSGQWALRCIDTGEATATGGRVARAAHELDGGTFGLTYADGVSDVDLGAVLAEHCDRGRAVTMTVVRPRSPWGKARIAEDGRITGFVEKPRLESWINGGFMFMEPRAIEFIGEGEALEREPLERAAVAGELQAFRHDGFWECMDTFKDAIELNELCAGGNPPWLAAAPSVAARPG